MDYPSTTVLAGATAHEHLLIMGMPPVNLLLTGGHGGIRKVLGMLLRDFDGPISAWYPGEPLVLPREARPGTMILHEVGLLGHDDQLQLLRWLEKRRPRTQIVSTTSAGLMPLVETGVFNDILYYRLNTVSVSVTE